MKMTVMQKQLQAVAREVKRQARIVGFSVLCRLDRNTNTLLVGEYSTVTVQPPGMNEREYEHFATRVDYSGHATQQETRTLYVERAANRALENEIGMQTTLLGCQISELTQKRIVERKKAERTGECEICGKVAELDRDCQCAECASMSVLEDCTVRHIDNPGAQCGCEDAPCCGCR